MARLTWTLRHGRPIIAIELKTLTAGTWLSRVLLADSGAGSTRSPCELILPEQDCRLCARSPFRQFTLGGAYVGTFPAFMIRARIPPLGFDRHLAVIGIPQPPLHLDGIACFRFLNRFTYGNFGDPALFGLEN